MGEPSTEWHEIPLAREANTRDLVLESMPHQVFTCVNMGNPHAVLFSENCELFELEKIPLLILFSSVSGIFFYVVMTYIKNKRNFEIAFGPHIALSGIWLLFIL